MRYQSGDCYALWSEQVVKLCERLDECRWMAMFWDHKSQHWSAGFYSIDEQMIDSVVREPQRIRQRHTG